MAVKRVVVTTGVWALWRLVEQLGRTISQRATEPSATRLPGWLPQHALKHLSAQKLVHV